MRVTPAMIGARLAADLNAAQAALARQQTLIASGRRVLAPSDDPGAFAEATVVRGRQAANAQFQTNLAGAREALGAGESVIGSVLEALTRAREVAVQGASDTNDAVARQSLSGEVDTLLESLLSFGNSRSPSGAMLFGGMETTVSPYTAVRDLAGRITGVTVNARGIDGATSAEVSDGTTIGTAISGTTLFGASTDPTYAFGVLVRLRDALSANDGTATGATLNDIGASIDRGALAQAVLGSRLGWLDAVDARLKDEAVVHSGSLSRLEDLDFVKASTDLAQMQTTYEAGLAAGARVLQRSLLDFLR